jgi:hypothetical protein
VHYGERRRGKGLRDWMKQKESHSIHLSTQRETAQVTIRMATPLENRFGCESASPLPVRRRRYPNMRRDTAPSMGRTVG